jgi:hypothetical protein
LQVAACSNSQASFCRHRYAAQRQQLASQITASLGGSARGSSAQSAVAETGCKYDSQVSHRFSDEFHSEKASTFFSCSEH